MDGYRFRASGRAVFVVLVTLGLDVQLPHLGSGRHGHASRGRPPSLLSLVVRAKPDTKAPVAQRPGLFILLAHGSCPFLPTI
jgi:hypothetical protein